MKIGGQEQNFTYLPTLVLLSKPSCPGEKGMISLQSSVLCDKASSSPTLASRPPVRRRSEHCAPRPTKYTRRWEDLFDTIRVQQECHFCKKHFSCRTSTLSHMRHVFPLSPTTPECPVDLSPVATVCPLCGKHFQNRRNTAVHIRQVCAPRRQMELSRQVASQVGLPSCIPSVPHSRILSSAGCAKKYMRPSAYELHVQRCCPHLAPAAHHPSESQAADISTLSVDGVFIEEVLHFRYLGRTLSADDNDAHAIEERLSASRGTYHVLMRPVFRTHVPVSSKVHVLSAFCETSLLYGAETWT